MLKANTTINIIGKLDPEIKEKEDTVSVIRKNIKLQKTMVPIIIITRKMEIQITDMKDFIQRIGKKGILAIMLI